MFDIKERRQNLGYSIRELADMIGVAKSTVHRWENGETDDMRRSKIPLLAEALKISPVQLIMDEVPEPVTIASDIVRVPIIGTIACGNPVLADENVIGHEYASVRHVGKDTCFYLTCKGESMLPTVKADSLVLIRQQANVENGEIAAVLFLENNSVTLKRVHKNNDSIILTADNPAYDPIVVNKNNPIKILGKAISTVNSL